MIVWDKKTDDECIAAGRKKELVSKYLLPDSIIEVKPTGKTTGEIVWEWHLWDHLIQDHDSTKANFGNVADHPELVDVNYVTASPTPRHGPKDAAKKDRRTADRKTDARGKSKAELDKLKSIGYAGSAGQPGAAGQPRLDPLQRRRLQRRSRPDRGERARVQRDLDHRPQHDDGRGGRSHRRPQRQGGRPALPLGQPGRLSGRRDDRDQRLFAQHNAHWIPAGLPGEGHMLVFNNGSGRPGGDSSSVDEIVLPVDAQGRTPAKRRGLRAGRGGLELLGTQEVGLLFLLHLRGTAPAQRQHA